VKNRFALNNSQRLISIEEVDRNAKERYSCLYCGDELIPRMGSIRVHHFAHKQQLHCNYESYLHQLGKLKFYEQYNYCLNNKIPFYIERPYAKICNACENISGIHQSCKLQEETTLFDLTQWFDTVQIEKGHKNFIADILLSSSKYDQIVFVEIAVSHHCEQEKIESGIRIIEITLTSEEDLCCITSCKIQRSQASFYNFKPIKQQQKPFYKSRHCKKPFDVFAVLNSGEAVKETLTMGELIKKQENNQYAYLKLLRPKRNLTAKDAKTYAELIKEAYQKRIRVVNCNVCQFCQKNQVHYDSIYRFYCNKYQVEFANTNDALKCKGFTPMVLEQ